MRPRLYAPPMRTRVEVAVFVTRKGAGEVLLLHRSPQHGGYWHVVAGGVEEGETAPGAAARDLRGELARIGQRLEQMRRFARRHGV